MQFCQFYHYLLFREQTSISSIRKQIQNKSTNIFNFIPYIPYIFKKLSSSFALISKAKRNFFISKVRQTRSYPQGPLSHSIIFPSNEIAECNIRNSYILLTIVLNKTNSNLLSLKEFLLSFNLSILFLNCLSVISSLSFFISSKSLI